MPKEVDPAIACLAVFAVWFILGFAYNAGEAVGTAAHYTGILA